MTCADYTGPPPRPDSWHSSACHGIVTAEALDWPESTCETLRAAQAAAIAALEHKCPRDPP